MTTELYWLALTVGISIFFFMPYTLDWINQRGVVAAMGNPSTDDPQRKAWADRAKKAHSNAVENLVTYVPLVIIAHLAEISSDLTLIATPLYFWARLTHYVVYTLGIPVVRTLAYFAGTIAQLLMLWALLTS